MSLINEEIPVYQVFSHPKTVEFMWSLDPMLRNNDVYKGLLDKFNPKLKKIPWARTGLIFDKKNGKPDKYLRSYESEIYSSIFREIYDEIFRSINKERIRSIKCFNWDSIDLNFKLMKTSIYRHNIGLEEKMTWLASLSIFLELYDVQVEEDSNCEGSEDFGGGQKIYFRFVEHFVKYYYRKYWLGKV
jgi:asparagine synthase (glutamine-hydrolysing)